MGHEVSSLAIKAEPIVIIRHNGRVPVIINSRPLNGAAQNPLSAILTFVSPEPKQRPHVPLLINIFKLAPAEARLATALVKGSTIEEAAGTLSTSCETARPSALLRCAISVKLFHVFSPSVGRADITSVQKQRSRPPSRTAP
jgi:hypothetical protein